MSILEGKYDYRMTCGVYFGVGAADNIAEKVKQFKTKETILISDEGNKSVGHPTRIAGLLREAGHTVTEYYDVQPEPTDSKGDEIAAIARDAGAELVVGIGGGSVLDTAKMVGVALKNEGKISGLLNSRYDCLPTLIPVPPIAPVIALPTTAGTGSEMSSVAVVSREGSLVKDAIMASTSLAIIDPVLMATAPPSITAYSGFDALSHSIESLTAGPVDPFSMAVALESVRLVIKYLKRAYDDGSDMEARSYLALASNFGGIAFTNTGLHFGHAFAHEAGALFHLPHGMASSYPIPAMIKYAGKYTPERVDAIVQAIGATTVEEAAQIVIDMMHYCNIKRFSEIGVTAEQARDIAEDAIAHNAFYRNTIVPLPVEEFKEIITDIVVSFDA
jgi:alcohol dehydrogenase class IV